MASLCTSFLLWLSMEAKEVLGKLRGPTRIQADSGLQDVQFSLLTVNRDEGGQQMCDHSIVILYEGHCTPHYAYYAICVHVQKRHGKDHANSILNVLLTVMVPSLPLARISGTLYTEERFLITHGPHRDAFQ